LSSSRDSQLLGFEEKVSECTKCRSQDSLLRSRHKQVLNCGGGRDEDLRVRVVLGRKLAMSSWIVACTAILAGTQSCRKVQLQVEYVGASTSAT